jgi:hypothetical protein
MAMQLQVVRVDKPSDVNVILGHSHFIKTVEDLHEAMVTSVPGVKFGVAFNESSGPRLVRVSGNDPELTELAAETARDIGAGHTFVIYLRGAFPIHVLRAVREANEVCRIYCATANPLEVVVGETELGRAVLGVVDGEPPLGIEGDEDKAERHELLRKFGYKL